MTPPPVQDLDALLALQLAVAWAGEAVQGEDRFGWWRTELTDPDAGGDFFSRLLPRTHAWAALVAVREAARRVDEAARRRVGGADGLWTLFHFGFALDERLDTRLAELRRSGVSPEKAFGASFVVGERFDRAAFLGYLEGLARGVKVEVVPGGRKLSGRSASEVDGAKRLAAALLPITSAYPLPFLPMNGS
jgi:hypothetical protein